jgi:osmoprotectant transport system substrate-binding protein
MKLGVGYEFLERKDGYQGLVRTYDLKFAEAPRVMDLGLLYRALENHSVDLVAGNNTDGLIEALGLVVLQDDRHYFPPYDAVPIIRPQTLEQFPASPLAFAELAGRITAEQMRKMNYAVDGKKEDAAQVAGQFLQATFGSGEYK